MSDDQLYQPLTAGDLVLEPLAEAHRAGLRAACAADDDIWEIYPFSYQGAAFDPQFDRLITPAGPRRAYAIMLAGVVVGMTAWIDQGHPGWSIEIGNTFILPAVRGTGLNGRIKRLMIDHAFACGLERLVFKIDSRNLRSQAAVAKLGVTREGVLRHERQTWTGHVRDTVAYSLLASEWPRV